MKKLLIAIVLHCCCFLGSAQSKITEDEARDITAHVMANFTESVSFAYEKGMSLDEFKLNLCSKAEPAKEGNAMIETAYSYLSNGIGKENIIKENNGISVANAFKFLLDEHNKGIESDETTLFGEKKYLENNDVAKAAECKWYQFWCQVHDFADWLVQNWPTIYDIILFILGH